jgi:glycosyltransferase involved in cell wall biosynthesis
MKKEEPLLSVRLMTYNHEEYIAQAVESCVMQVCDFKFEVVIGDDFSTDKTLEIALKYQKKYPEIVRVLHRKKGDDYYVNRQKKGRLFNFIDIVNNCKGKYIALLDGDDYWTDPLKLQKQVDFLEANEECILTGHDAFIVDGDNTVVSEAKLPVKYKRSASGDELKQMFWVLTLSMVFRNIDELRNYPVTLLNVPNGDTCLISLLGNYGAFHYHEDIKPAAYRVHDGGVWSVLNHNQKIINQCLTLISLRKYYNQRKDNEMIKFLSHKIKNNYRQQFDYSMQNDSLFRKSHIFYWFLFKNNNWKTPRNFTYLIKAYLKSIISKK